MDSDRVTRPSTWSYPVAFPASRHRPYSAGPSVSVEFPLLPPIRCSGRRRTEGPFMAFADVVAEVDAACRARDIKMLGPQKIARLIEILWEARPQLVVEVGTAIGYSGLWIAETLREQGQGLLVTLEMDADRAAEAAANFRRAGLEQRITLLIGDAR